MTIAPSHTLCERIQLAAAKAIEIIFTWTTAESSYCCIINGFTSTVCVKADHMPLSWNSELGHSDHTWRVKHWLLTEPEWVGLESSDAVKCICRLLGQCFGVLVEYSSKRNKRPSLEIRRKGKLQRTLTLNSLRKNNPETHRTRWSHIQSTWRSSN